MATQLVEHERIRTTHTKCLALKQIADKIIKMGVRWYHATETGKKIYWERKIQGILTTKESRTKVLNVLAERFK
jgi:ribosomal protein L17